MTAKRVVSKAKAATSAVGPHDGLFVDVRALILQAREGVARTVDMALTSMHWHIGRRIHEDLLSSERAAYGKDIVPALGRKLSAEFGRGFAEKSLWHMIKFAESFPESQIVSTLSRELSWSHFQSLIYISDPLKRDFYVEMCRIERWSVRTLRRKIDSMLYERVGLSRKPDVLIRQELDALHAEGKLTPDLVFQDPYLLDFLGLRDTPSVRNCTPQGRQRGTRQNVACAAGCGRLAHGTGPPDSGIVVTSPVQGWPFFLLLATPRRHYSGPKLGSRRT